MGYYRGDCNYAAGDYYRGDYYQGDFLGIGGALKKAAGVAFSAAKGFITGGPINAVRSAIATAVAPRAQVPTLSLQGPPLDQIGLINVQTGVGGGTIPSMSLTPSGQLVPCQMKGYRVNKSGYYRHPRGNPAAAVYVPPKSVCVKSRRLNVANPRALRRAIRRAQGFAKLARRVMTFVSAKAPKGRAKFKRKR